MSDVRLDAVRKVYPGGVEAVKGVSLEIADGQFCVLVGPSGCGKSTLLRMVAGLETISGGTCAIDGKVVNEIEPAERDIAMVFQNYALYPHMSVYDNMAYGLRNRGTPKDEIDARVKEAARILEVEPFLARKPKALSGGQRQRVAMGRAIVRKPKVFLFDEPLSNLDAKLRIQMRVEIKKLQRALKTTSIYVTHDQLEAMTLADQLVVMNKGQVEQAGAPLDLYEKPQTIFVAGFIGAPPMNLVTVPEAGLPGLTLIERPAGPVVLGIRPEHLHEQPMGPDTLTVEIVVSAVEAVGAETYLYGALHGHGPELIVRVPGRATHAPGQRIRACAEASQLHFFNPQTGRRID
ncbi:MAG: sn-glycerol-3-phosphate ABC transporter ATP-binding protein UgpC [Methylobacterium sp.]|nr:MAG: sn-glycerol-3-phosphate ABC transporter ATP-binding protein UgpC [Methylobacterium sp.]